MSAGNPRRSRRRLTTNLRVESLEDRRLLSADFGNSPVNQYANDPFSPTAFPLTKVLQRTETHSYDEGELSVAFSFNSIADKHATINDQFWNNHLPGVEIDSWTVEWTTSAVMAPMSSSSTWPCRRRWS